MDNQEINTPKEAEVSLDIKCESSSPLEEESKKDTKDYNKMGKTVGIFLTYTILVFVISYMLGYKEGENKYKNFDPKLHVFLSVSNGPTQVIPVTLTKNGIGIKFQNSLTNIIAIGIEEVDKRN